MMFRYMRPTAVLFLLVRYVAEKNTRYVLLSCLILYYILITFEERNNFLFLIFVYFSFL